MSAAKRIRARERQQRRRRREASPAALPKIRPQVAGVDLGSVEHWVCGSAVDGEHARVLDSAVRVAGVQVHRAVSDLMKWLRPQLGPRAAWLQSTRWANGKADAYGESSFPGVRGIPGSWTDPFPFTKQLLLTILLLCVSLATCGGRPASTTDPVLPHRMLLVASEGLYIVERDGTSSWSYLPEPAAGQSWLYDLVYDGAMLENGNVLYGTSAYVREIDLAGSTVWEYAVTLPDEVKSFVVRSDDGRVAVLHSGDQAILELERGTGRVLKRISLPAEGNEHTRYNYLRLTPAGGYLAALRAEERFVEVDREGKFLRSFSVPELPCMAKRLEDGSTLGSGRFGVKRFDADGKEVWSLRPEDVQDSFPMLLPCGFVPLDNGRVLVVNSDWHYKEPGQNRVPVFIVREDKSIEWTLDVAAFEAWKQSQIDPRSQLKEHRCGVLQLLPET